MENYDTILCEKCKHKLYDYDENNLHEINELDNISEIEGSVTCKYCGRTYYAYCEKCHEYRRQLHCEYCGEETILKVKY